mgnify:CR=1 FL=1
MGNPWGDKPMIVTTTPSVEGYQIAEYLGIVTGEAIMGANIVRDIFASVTDIIGGRSGAYEAKLADARETALSEIGVDVDASGCDAVFRDAPSFAIRLVDREEPGEERASDDDRRDVEPVAHDLPRRRVDVEEDEFVHGRLRKL